MDYMDEKILEQRQAQKEQRHTTLKTGIYVNRELIEFTSVQLFNNQIDVMLPTTFIDMPKSVMKIKYPSEQRPQVIKTSLDATVNFTFNWFDARAENSERVREASNQFQAVLMQVNPAVKTFDLDEVISQHQCFRFFWYKSFAIDSQIYNLVCVTAIRNDLLMETFSCPYDERYEWEDLAKKIFLTTQEHFL